MKKNLLLVLSVATLSSCASMAGFCPSKTTLPQSEIDKIPNDATVIYLTPLKDGILDTIFEDMAQNIMNDGYLIEYENAKRYSLYAMGKTVAVRPVMIDGVRGLGINGFDKKYTINKFYPCLNDNFFELVELTMNFDTTLVKRTYK